MKCAAILIIAVILSSTVCGQLPTESQTFLTESLSRKNMEGVTLDKEELLPQFIHFDYSSLWTKYDKDILAFIGDDYQRLRVKYLSVIKNAMDPTKYYVYGKRMVKSSVCSFMGEIQLIHMRVFSESERKRMYEDVIAKHDEETARYYSHPRYTLLAQYRFFEDPYQEGTGSFTGILRTDCYVDANHIFYDDLDSEIAGYRNNQYVGIWTSYASGASERSNWGEWRIPYPGDLGSETAGGDFGPREKYLDKGWETYAKARTYDTTAQKEEEREWWKE